MYISGVAAYAAAKHAVVGLTKGAARDYAADGIRINVVRVAGPCAPMPFSPDLAFLPVEDDLVEAAVALMKRA